MPIKLSTELRTARAAQISTTVGANAVIRFHIGTRAASPADAPTAAIGSLTGTTAFGTAANGALTVTANFVTNSSLTLPGTATWFRIYKSGGSVAVIDGDVGTDIFLSYSVFAAGDTISFNTMTITEGNA